MSHNADSSSPASPASSPAQRPPRLALLIATGFGLGYLPKAPGTWGSAGAILIAAIISALSSVSLEQATTRNLFYYYWVCYLGVVVLASLVGVWASRNVGLYLRREDPPIIVIDEIAGQLIALIAAGWDVIIATYLDPNGGFSCVAHVVPQWKYLLAGFILFRVFDIWKPWPVRAAERLPGGWGIMADDWVAGIYAALCLWGLQAMGL
jgi:phosphatidylglycerophosphatase A